MPTLDPLSLAVGAALAAVVTWALLRGRQAAAETAERQARDAFAALAADALRQNSDQFIARASETLDGIRRQAASDLDLRQQSIAGVVTPIREHLERVTVRVEELDRIRQESYGAIRQQLEAVALGQQDVATQARSLVQALRAPQARGRWGELQLERVVELAGMAEHVDFTQQVSVDTVEGRLRPDLVVHLPGDRTIVVDAKTPLDAYLRAVEATDGDHRAAALRQHGQQLRTHVGQLSSKTYWDQFGAAPDFVVMFVPGEAFLSAACLEDPQLLEDALHKRVILASPTMLVALLRTVALGWRHEKLAEHAEHIGGLAQELVERLATVAEHLGSAGDKLEGAVKAYNQAVGSLESRVLVTARKVRELGVGGKKEVPTVEPVVVTPRALPPLE